MAVFSRRRTASACPFVLGSTSCLDQALKLLKTPLCLPNQGQLHAVGRAVPLLEQPRLCILWSPLTLLSEVRGIAPSRGNLVSGETGQLIAGDENDGRLGLIGVVSENPLASSQTV